MKFFSGVLALVLIFQIPAFSQAVVGGDEFQARIDSAGTAQLIDVRTPEEFKAGHLPNSVNIDFKKADFLEKMSKLNKDEPVLVYCLAGGRSASAAQLLVENGFKEVYDLEGGYLKWSTENRPVAGIVVKKEALVGMPVSEYESILNTEMPVLVDFTAKWCAPCKAMYPYIKKLETEFEGRALVKIIDIDVNKTLTQHLGITYLPLIYLYKNGKIVWQTTGKVSEQTLRNEITKAL